MRLLVVGGTGRVGSAVVRLARERGHEVFFTCFSREPGRGGVRLDVRDAEAVGRLVSRLSPDAVVNASGTSDPSICEFRGSEAWEIHVRGAENVAQACAAAECALIHVSADQVFDGERGMYSEEDEPRPLNRYGRAKLAGERAVLGVKEDACVVRAGPVFGVGGEFWEGRMVRRLLEGRWVGAVADRFASPVLDVNLAEMILDVVERGITGIIHLAGDGRASRYELAVALASALGVDESRVLPLSFDGVGNVARWPRDVSLDVSRAKRELAGGPLTLEEAAELFAKSVREAVHQYPT